MRVPTIPASTANRSLRSLGIGIRWILWDIRADAAGTNASGEELGVDDSSENLTFLDVAFGVTEPSEGGSLGDCEEWSGDGDV